MIVIDEDERISMRRIFDEPYFVKKETKYWLD